MGVWNGCISLAKMCCHWVLYLTHTDDRCYSKSIPHSPKHLLDACVSWEMFLVAVIRQLRFLGKFVHISSRTSYTLILFFVQYRVTCALFSRCWSVMNIAQYNMMQIFAGREVLSEALAYSKVHCVHKVPWCLLNMHLFSSAPHKVYQTLLLLSMSNVSWLSSS